MPTPRLNHAPKTEGLYRAILSNHLTYFHNVPLSELKGEHIDRYKSGCLKELKPVSFNVELRMLRSAFNAQEFQGLTERMEEVWLREVILCAVLTGMSKGELLNPRWSGINMSRKTMDIQRWAKFP